MATDFFAVQSNDAQFISWAGAKAGTEYVITVTHLEDRPDNEFNGEPKPQVWVHGTTDEGDVILPVDKGKKLHFALGQAQREADVVIEPGVTIRVWTDGLKPSPRRSGMKFRDYGAEIVSGKAAPKKATKPAPQPVVEDDEDEDDEAPF